MSALGSSAGVWFGLGALLLAAMGLSTSTVRWRIVWGGLLVVGSWGLSRLAGALFGEHLLTVLLAVPLLGALAVLFTPRQWPNTVRRLSVAVMVLEFALSLALLSADYGHAGYHFVERYAWVPAFGISYKVGVDGISLWLVLLTTLLSPIALYGSWTSVGHKVKEYAFAFLALEGATIGAFVALDLFLFYVFWELMLVPMYLIIGVWGGKNRVYAAVKFFLYTMAGSVLMLLAILYTVWSYAQLAGQPSFDLEELQRLVFPYTTQLWLFAAFALAFAVKVPMFPVHTWLPDAHVQAPTGGSVILAAVLLKLGTYGFLRFAMPLFPLATHYMAPLLLVPLALVGILYGAWCAWVQRDVKKLVAYSSVAHMGFVMMGLFAANEQGVSGALLQMLNHGVSTGALFLLVGVIYERRHTRDLSHFGGLAKVMPWYALLFVTVTMSSIGVPGTNGFVGEFMILLGTFTSTGLQDGARPFAVVGALGVVFAAVYMLRAVLEMFWGPLDKEENRHLPDLSWREFTALAPLMLLIFWVGLYPRTFLEPMEASVRHFVTQYEGRKHESARTSETKLLPPGAFVKERTASLPRFEPWGAGAPARMARLLPEEK